MDRGIPPNPGERCRTLRGARPLLASLPYRPPSVCGFAVEGRNEKPRPLQTYRTLPQAADCAILSATTCQSHGNPLRQSSFSAFPPEPHAVRCPGQRLRRRAQGARRGHRVRIVGLLIDGPMDVSEIAKRLGVSQYNVSKHLRILREAGLLQVEKSGRQHRYALREHPPAGRREPACSISVAAASVRAPGARIASARAGAAARTRAARR